MNSSPAQVLNDLGNLLLSFLIIWAYMVWFQFMLIWIANLPVDVIWYLPRLRGGWQWVAYACSCFISSCRSSCCLMRVVKQTPRLVALGGRADLLHATGVRLLPGHALVSRHHLADHWMDFLTPLGIGGIWFAYFFWELGRRPLLPPHDPDQRSGAPPAPHRRGRRGPRGGTGSWLKNVDPNPLGADVPNRWPDSSTRRSVSSRPTCVFAACLIVMLAALGIASLLVLLAVWWFFGLQPPRIGGQESPFPWRRHPPRSCPPNRAWSRWTGWRGSRRRMFISAKNPRSESSTARADRRARVRPHSHRPGHEDWWSSNCRCARQSQRGADQGQRAGRWRRTELGPDVSGGDAMNAIA